MGRIPKPSAAAGSRDSAVLARDLQEAGFACEETHISRVFLDAWHAYKVKKPVDFGFLDYSTPEKRRRACEAEVELNRRFSPDVYLGLVPVTREAGGPYRLGGKGPIVDWAVKMLRLPASERGDVRLAAGSLTPRHLERLAERLADFHASAPADARARRFGEAPMVARNVEDTFTAARPLLGSLLGHGEAARLEAGLLGWVRDHGSLLRERMEQGRIRDGHGDLRLSQVYFDSAGRPLLLDCIEFNDRYRYGDVAVDIAFPAMDLAVRGRREYSEILLSAYARASGDYDLYAVVDFYQAYRACVRGKIAAHGALDASASKEARELAVSKTRDYFRHAFGFLSRRPADSPVIALCGGIASGKSTLAAALGTELGAPVLESDRIRKRLAGFHPLEARRDGLWQGLYRPDKTERVYAELRRCARLVMDSGRPVLLDASFRARRERTLLRAMAAQAGRPCLVVECRADREVAAERLRRRAQGPSVSDGHEELVDAFLASWEPEEGPDAEEVLVLDTSRPLPECVNAIRSRIADLARPMVVL